METEGRAPGLDCNALLPWHLPSAITEAEQYSRASHRYNTKLLNRSLVMGGPTVLACPAGGHFAKWICLPTRLLQKGEEKIASQS